MTAAPELGALVQLDLRDSEIRSISGIDSDEIQIKLYPQWDLGKILILRFTDVKDSWMSRMHPDDANWWLADEIALDEERPGRDLPNRSPASHAGRGSRISYSE